MRKNIHIEHIWAMLVFALFAVAGVFYLVGWLAGSASWQKAGLVIGLVAIVVAWLPACIAIAVVSWERLRK